MKDRRTRATSGRIAATGTKLAVARYHQVRPRK